MKKLGLPFILATVILLIAFVLLPRVAPAFADGPHHVAPDCVGIPLPCYLTVQAAIDAASVGDIIEIAGGTYTTINNYGGGNQIAYVSKTITIQGGYSPDFTTPPDPSANPTILDARGQGRAIYISGEISPTIEGLRVTGGNAFNGGGIYIITARARLSNMWVYSNSADFLGGGIYSVGGSTIESSKITSNTAASGGGGLVLVGGGGAAQDMGAAKFVSNTVSHNSACYAGGVDLVWSTAVLTANIIHGNTAKFCGSMTDSGIGGAIIIDQESDATLINNLIFENEADISGSGLYISGSSPRLWHSTIARNFGGNGSGIHIADRFGVLSTVWFTNTILVSHRLGITIAANNTATLESTLWFDNLVDWAGPGTIMTGTNNYTGSPNFVNPENGDYHLQLGSAAIDQGVVTGVTIDIDGDSRGVKPDLGADELVYLSSYLPIIVKN